MSEVAGRLAAQAGAYFLEKPLGGRGLLLGGVAGVAPGRVVVISGRMVGYNAAVIALGLGAHVRILDKSVDRLRHLEQILSGRVELVMSSSARDRALGARGRRRHRRRAHPGARAPKLVTRGDDRRMKRGRRRVRRLHRPGRLLRDLAPTTTPTRCTSSTASHYCVSNMPGAVPITSTVALTNVTLPYVEAIADLGVREAIARDRSLARGVNVFDGKLTYEAVAEAHGLEYSTPLEELLPLEPV